MVGGEVRAEISQASRAKERVSQGMEHDVTVGVAMETRRPGDLDPPEHQRLAGTKRVAIEAQPDPGPGLPRDGISDAAQAHVFVGLTTNGKGESEKIAKNFGRHGFEALDLTHDELAKEHLRHLVGGHSALAQDERLMRFTFPERPGALLKFLSLMQPTWNISLFHYRNQGADYGRILVGMQVPSEDKAAFDAFLATLGYPYVEETLNPAYRLFLRSK